MWFSLCWYDLYTLIYVMYALLALELSNTCICISGACFMNRSWAFISWLIGEKVKAKGGGWPWYPPMRSKPNWSRILYFNFMKTLLRMYFVSIKSLVVVLFNICHQLVVRKRSAIVIRQSWSSHLTVVQHSWNIHLKNNWRSFGNHQSFSKAL